MLKTVRQEPAGFARDLLKGCLAIDRTRGYFQVKRAKSSGIILAVALLLQSWPLQAEIESLAEKLVEAHARGQLLPQVSTIDASLSLDSAYRVQQLFTLELLKSEGKSGYKAGLTTAASQSYFGVDAALSGVLFQSMNRTGERVISLDQFHNLFIETELAFILSEPIHAPIEDTVALRRVIGSVVPALELPDRRFPSTAPLTAVDLVAGNLSAAGYVIGESQGHPMADLSALTITLSRDGETVSQGRGSDAFGDPWAAALWLVNHLIEYGWTMEPGQILLSGALGKVVEAQPGTYEANFGPLGKLSVEIR